MTIGKVATQTGMNIETIRYYEKLGLVCAPMRTEGGTRLFDRDSIQRLFFIKRARELGFSLDEVRALLQLSSDSKVDCHSAQSIAEKHLQDILKKIEDLNQLANVLLELSGKCSVANSSSCPILESLNKNSLGRA